MTFYMTSDSTVRKKNRPYFSLEYQNKTKKIYILQYRQLDLMSSLGATQKYAHCLDYLHFTEATGGTWLLRLGKGDRWWWVCKHAHAWGVWEHAQPENFFKLGALRSLLRPYCTQIYIWTRCCYNNTGTECFWSPGVTVVSSLVPRHMAWVRG